MSSLQNYANSLFKKKNPWKKKLQKDEQVLVDWYSAAYRAEHEIFQGDSANNNIYDR